MLSHILGEIEYAGFSASISKTWDLIIVNPFRKAQAYLYNRWILDTLTHACYVSISLDKSVSYTSFQLSV